jgi:hypothetical protein
MKQDDRELLLKDLCARLPYGVVVGYSGKDNPNTLDKMGKVIYVDIRFGMIQMQSESGISYGLPPSEFIKPYLRPMSSMTEEEKIDYQAFFNYDGVEYPEEYIDWLNAHHFDYRGLIEKGLALEALEGMYK